MCNRWKITTYEPTFMYICMYMYISIYILYIYIYVCVCVCVTVPHRMLALVTLDNWQVVSHQTRNLSHPHNSLSKGCDPCFTQYHFDKGRCYWSTQIPLYNWCHDYLIVSIKVWVHAYWQTSNTVHSDYACSLEGHWYSQSRGSVTC